MRRDYTTPSVRSRALAPRLLPFPAILSFRCWHWDVRLGYRPVLRFGFAIALTLVATDNIAHADQTIPVTPVAKQSAVDPYPAFVTEASRRFDIPASWIHAVIHVESRGRTGAVSPKGAMGLMQIMPDTWAELRLRYRLGANPYDPHDNILAGTAYLRALYDRFGQSGFLAAYNVGPRRYQAHLSEGQPLREETRLYLASLTQMLPELQIDPANLLTVDVPDWMRSALFAVPSTSPRPADIAPSGQPSAGSSTPASVASGATFAPHSNGLFAPLNLAAAR